MKFKHLNIFKIKSLPVVDKDPSVFAEIVKSFFNKLLPQDQNTIFNKDELEYWKNKIFSIISVFLIVVSAPLFFFGAYMFYNNGETVKAIGEVLIYVIIAVVIMQRSLSLRFRRLFIVLILYFISILLLVATGEKGAGMVCVACSLILAGCLLEKRQSYQVVAINIIIFIALTMLLMNGYFDGTYMEHYKSVWLINVVTTQACGISLLFLMNTIYSGLENQTQAIKRSNELLATSETKHKAMIANISDVIAILDGNGFVKYISPNLEQRFGWTIEDFYNKSHWEKIHPEDRNYIEREFEVLLETDGIEKKMEARSIAGDGEIKYIELIAVNLRKNSNINGILVNFHDITQHKIREEKILYLNHRDVLTGLYNRRFYDKEKEYLDTESQLPLSVIIGDINGLKIINDSLGHMEGDKLLKAIAKILESCCRKQDVLARTGGDEFSILLPRTSSETVYEIIKKVNLACEEYNKKMSSELLYTSISLGSATKTTISESLDATIKVAEDYMYKRKLLEGRSLHSAVISSMKTALSEKSQETEEHAQRLVKLSKAVGLAITLTDEQFDELELFATLHDIGKIGIDDGILNKPGKLTDVEWLEMKRHSEIGYRIAMSSPELMSIAEYILTHHERFDGTGYPQGLIGENIPLLSRIVAVVDAYDAMTEDRPYRKGMSKEAAMSEIIKNSGSQFDPGIAKIFIEILSNCS